MTLHSNPDGPGAEQLKHLSRPALWLLAARVKTLGLSVVPVAAGTWSAAQHGGWRSDVFVAATGAALAIQIGTNLWNDAADAASGLDGPARLGPPRLTALGLLPSGQVRRAAAGTFAAALVPGLYLTLIGGWAIALLGLVALTLGFAYSSGPRPLSATPLGELLVVAFFGVAAVAGTVHLHGQSVTWEVARLGVIIGLPAAAVLLTNNHRDRVCDARGGRQTLAILAGVHLSRLIFAVLITVALVAAIGVEGLCTKGWIGLVPAACFAVGLVVVMWRVPVSRGLNRLIPATALFQALLFAGIVAGVAICG